MADVGAVDPARRVASEICSTFRKFDRSKPGILMFFFINLPGACQLNQRNTYMDSFDGRIWTIPLGIPEDAVAYGRTRDFTPETLPDMLKSEHTTKSGVWGLIHVVEGRLLYALESPHRGEIIVEENEAAVIHPQVPHHVSFVEPGRFYIEFHKKPMASQANPDELPAGIGQPHINAPGFHIGINRDLIAAIVDRFYASVRADTMLGPIFADVVKDWPAHLARLCDFWSAVILASVTYKGDILEAHVAMPDLTEQHFVRWLELFDQTLQQLCTPEQTAFFVDRALRIAGRVRATRTRMN